MRKDYAEERQYYERNSDKRKLSPFTSFKFIADEKVKLASQRAIKK